eukprot:scaffold39697_cov152-Isochrysis_galbana.AAC.2
MSLFSQEKISFTAAHRRTTRVLVIHCCTLLRLLLPCGSVIAAAASAPALSDAPDAGGAGATAVTPEPRGAAMAGVGAGWLVAPAARGAGAPAAGCDFAPAGGVSS